jgi:hypothetical protein
MPLCSQGQEVGGQLQVVGVVEDEQPVGVREQPALDGGDEHFLILGVVFGELQRCCQLAKIGEQGEQRLGSCPQDGLVLVSIAIGIFDGGLGLAHAAQSADGLRLRQGRCLRVCELLMQPAQQVFAPREEGVAAKRQGPDLHLARAH